MRTIETEITINAPVEKVWQILTDFPAYPDWNPFIRRFDVAPKLGNRFSVTLQPHGSKPMTFKPVCLNLEPNKEFRWLGKLFVSGLFDGEHVFQLEPLPDGKTRLIHKEYFRGILVPLLWNMLDTKTRYSFNRMNEALKERSEKKLYQMTA